MSSKGKARLNDAWYLIGGATGDAEKWSSTAMCERPTLFGTLVEHEAAMKALRRTFNQIAPGIAENHAPSPCNVLGLRVWGGADGAAGG